jgi:hypothetical protein
VMFLAAFPPSFQKMKSLVKAKNQAMFPATSPVMFLAVFPQKKSLMVTKKILIGKSFVGSGGFFELKNHQNN